LTKNPSKKPKIFYSIGARTGGQGLSLVAQKAGEALSKSKMMDLFLSYGYDKKYIGKRKIINFKKVYFQPFKVFSFLPSKYYYTMKRVWMDYKSTLLLRKSQANIFHGWTHSSLTSLAVAKKKRMLTIVERGNSHPLFTREILKDEYQKYGTKNQHEIKKDKSIFKKFNLWRYEFNEALIEIERADYIFVNSNFCAKTYIKFGVKKDKLIVIPRGFDPNIYHARPKQNKNEKFILLFIGNLQARKGIIYILEAWDKLNLKNAELWFVGNVGDEIKIALKRYQKKWDNIKIFGNVSNPSSFYQKGSAFIFPSIDEGSAKVVYEAMASALPCIITENAGCPVTNAGMFIIPIRSSDAIAKYTLKLYKDTKLRNKMGEKAARSIRPYTWKKYQETLIKQYVAIYKKAGQK